MKTLDVVGWVIAFLCIAVSAFAAAGATKWPSVTLICVAAGGFLIGWSLIFILFGRLPDPCSDDAPADEEIVQ